MAIGTLSPETLLLLARMVMTIFTLRYTPCPVVPPPAVRVGPTKTRRVSLCPSILGILLGPLALITLYRSMLVQLKTPGLLLCRRMVYPWCAVLRQTVGKNANCGGLKTALATANILELKVLRGPPPPNSFTLVLCISTK